MSLVGAGDLLKNFGPSSCFVLFSRSPTVISPSKSHPGAGIPSFHEQLRVRIYLRLFSSSSFPCTLPQTPGDRKYFWMLSDISPGLSRPTTGEMTQTQHWWPSVFLSSLRMGPGPGSSGRTKLLSRGAAAPGRVSSTGIDVSPNPNLNPKPNLNPNLSPNPNLNPKPEP